MAEETRAKASSSNVTDREVARKELATLIEKRRRIQTSLYELEKQIYNLETSYLEDTHHVGNLLRGWEGYLTGRGSGALKIPKKSRFKESDRLFTLSSATGLKHAEASAPPPSNDDAFAIATALREVRGGGGKGKGKSKGIGKKGSKKPMHAAGKRKRKKTQKA